MQKQTIFSALKRSVLPVAAVAALSALLADANGAWYMSLRKPTFTPPPWVFPLAWGIVYVCAMASLYLLLRSAAPVPPAVTALLIAAGALDVLWPAVFFRLHALLAACAVLLVLLCALAWAIGLLYPKSRASALLLIPHLLWGLFALILNVGILLLNAA
ncbi:MAG: TspO/MBR family protein [Candidatus Spyradocola sp.]